MRSARLRRVLAVILTFAAFLLASGAISGASAMVTPRLKPPAPGPAYASRADLARLEAEIKALERRRWSEAKALAQTVEDPAAHNLAEWFYFYAEDPDVTLQETDAFLDAHPDWPAAYKIQAHAEEEMPDSTPAQAVLQFFGTRDPVTGTGKLQLARALLATGDREAAELRIRDAWINHDFSLKDEQRILSSYANILTADDHAARVDRLLWGREVTASRRIYSRLAPRDRRMAEARAALLLAASTGPKLFESLPLDERMDPGVLLAAVRYYRRAKEEPRAVSLAKLAPKDPATLRNPSRWWDETQLLMRWALTEKQYADAYAMASGHGLEPGGDFAEAEFNAGWIALRFLAAPDRAKTHFSALAATVDTPISLSRGYYWLGRAAEQAGDTAEADGWYARAAKHIYTYYGQLAAEKIGAAAMTRTFDSPVIPTPEDKTRFSSRPTVAALRILSDLKEDQPFLIFAYNVDDQLESPGEYVELARLADRMDAPHVTVRAGKVAIGRDAFAAEVAYPLVYIPEEATRFAPPELILGVSRQESEFNPRAYSRAGARGMMQLIPSTAQLTARKEKLRYLGSSDLFDPLYNMTIGSAHLSHLLERYNGSRIMTFAAYNAGASRVSQWVERYGDPRSPDVDPIDWVEQIPFSETRNYVQRVLENAQVYRGRLANAPIAGKLAADLELGGPRGRAGILPGIGYAQALPPVPERIIKLASNAPPPRQPAEALAAPATDNAPAREESSVNEAAAAPAEVKETDVGANDASAPGRTRLAKPSVDEPAAPSPAARLTEASAPAPAAVQPGAAAPAAGEPQAGDNASAALNTASGVKVLNAQSAPLPAAASAAAKETLASAPEASADEANCRAYLNYIAETEQEDASAADLNAGMLAELQSGAGNC